MNKIYVVEYLASYMGADIRYISRSKEKADDVRDKIAQESNYPYKQDSDGNWSVYGDMIVTSEYTEDEMVND